MIYFLQHRLLSGFIRAVAHETYYLYAGLLALDLVLLATLYGVTGSYPPVLHDVAYLLVAALAGAAGQRAANGHPPAPAPTKLPRLSE